MACLRNICINTLHKGDDDDDDDDDNKSERTIHKGTWVDPNRYRSLYCLMIILSPTG